MFDFKSFPELQTDRLVLRCLSPNDADYIFEIRSDFEVTKYNSGPAYTDRQQAIKLIEKTLEGFASKKSLYWGITMRGNDTVIGQLGFNYWDSENNVAEVGFDLKRECWRKGIMSEALTEIIHFGFSEMGLNRIGAQVSAHNTSCKLLLESLKFVHEGTQRQQYYENGIYHDLDLFSLLRCDCDGDFINHTCIIINR